jgi:hypothetical protein
MKETVMKQEQKVVSLDMEWDTRKNANGEIVNSEKTALLQIGYRRPDGVICAVLFQIHHLKYLPTGFSALLNDPDITIVGVGLTTDLEKLGKDFKCKEMTSLAITRCQNLGMYARERDVVQDGTVGMETLIQIVLKEKIDKSKRVRCSKWSRKDLSIEQTD